MIKWVGFICAVWIIGMLLGATFDAQSSAAGTWGLENESALDYITNIKRITYSEEETGRIAWLTPNPLYFDALFSLLAWDFSFLKCPESSPGCGYAYFRYIVLIPFTVAALLGFIILFITLLQGFIPHT